ncbi:MoaA/NifB/PqqE/SkfB family radical SAM enzyme [Clostridium punense]|uniref:MoaA/NifB/PqqE/SkfB family radical SAM enzyme n=1 Tax=Clostridium punense TaxID=1054297 RepID=A0ABS4K5E1_9CLOT|nr:MULTISPECIES: radical SAM protein [Clostridium]EQB86580.1 hypothetical protein M918_13320 [Clostridium sp. BL8]MBP2022500.1 MoaA/NifB/PqqE/SkfB family radical SAM enzyme [Clostridium punense]
MKKDLNFVVKLTTNCPANCMCCINRQKEIKFKNENNSIFDITVFEKICIKIKKMGATYVCLSGGEPTMVSNIDEYFKIAHSNGLSVRLNTNGWGVTKEKIAKWLSLGLEQVVLSIYSLDRNVIRKTRGNEALLDKSLEAAEIIKNHKKENDFVFIIQTVIMKQNYSEMSKLLEFAFFNKADLFWTSYLEDAINLSEIRMEKKDIENFKRETIPKMKSIIEKHISNTNHKENLKFNINKLYKQEYDDYIYHDTDFDCHWLGVHLTFYPNGTIYPCPGHEYFSSTCQYNINYESIDDFLTLDSLNKNVNNKPHNCKYCPQGIFSDIIINENEIYKY